MCFKARRTEFCEAMGVLCLGKKSGGRLIAQALAPWFVKCSKREARAIRSDLTSSMSTFVEAIRRWRVFGSWSFRTRSSVRRQGMYVEVSQPSSGSSNSLVRKTASSCDFCQTVRSQDSPSWEWSARRMRSSMVSASIRSPSNPKKVRAISRSQEYWTVLSIRCRFRARFRQRSVGSRPGSTSEAGIPAEWASSV